MAMNLYEEEQQRTAMPVNPDEDVPQGTAPAAKEPWEQYVGTVGKGLYRALPQDIKSQFTSGNGPRQLEQMWNAVYRTYGRAPTQSEITKYMPAFLENTAHGRATILEAFERDQKSPEAMKKNAPGQYGNVEQMFQSTLGRNATDQEKEHFGTLLATGDVDSYTLGQFLQQLPEYTKKQDAAFRNELTGELQGQDARYFNEQVMPGIQSTFANQGRDVRSSGFANAIAQAATQQNRQRETFLSNLTAQQYQGQAGAAREDYLNNAARMYQGQDYAKSRADQLSDRTQQRTYDLQDFNMQKQAYDEYLRRYGKRSGGMGGIGTLAGMGIGALGAGLVTGGMGAPAGAALGGSIGGGAGSTFDAFR
jgi:hypothetical protein